METPPSAKLRRGSPPIPPNYVSLRQLQELRLKEKEEQEAEAATAAATAMAKRDAARKAEIGAMAAAAIKRDAARKSEAKVSAAVSWAHVRVKEKRDGGPGPLWVPVAHQSAFPPLARREAVSEAVPIGASRGNKGPADAPRGGGKPEGKAKGEVKGKVSVIASAQTRAADESGKLAEASSHGGKPENKGGGKGKEKEKTSGDSSAEPGSIGGSGESAVAPYRRHKNRKWKKGAAGRSAEPSADSAPAETAGASPPQGVKPENTGKPKSAPGGKRADASAVVSDSSRGKKADATPAPATSAAAGVVGVLRVMAETKPEGLIEGHRRSPAVEVQGAAEQKPRVVSRRAWPRPSGDRYNGTGEQLHGRVWVPKAAAGFAGR